MLPEAIAILRTLVGFDTVSHHSNLQLIRWVETYLDAHAVPHWRVNEEKDGVHKTSLLARIGPDLAGGIILSGHTDVVPVEGQQWTGGSGCETAFTLVERDEKLFGRGTSDMKGFIATALAMVPHWQGMKLQKPIWLAFSHDEEVGCRCAEPMAIEFTRRTIRPQLVIVGEPTLMQVVDEHKGIDSFETIITGKEGHSSNPELGVNAAYYAGELIYTLNRITDAERAKAEENSRYRVPYSTAHIGIVSSGKARNIIPQHAEIRWEVRPMPGADMATMLAPFYARQEALNAEIKARFPECGIVTNRLTHVHGLKKKDEADYLALAHYLAGSNAAPTAVAYATEGGAFGEHGFPTVICGPGSIDQAHAPDEFIAISQLEQSLGMMERVGEVLLK